MNHSIPVYTPAAVGEPAAMFSGGECRIGGVLLRVVLILWDGAMYTVFRLDAPYSLIIATTDADLADAIVLACAAEGIAAAKIGW